MRNRVMELSSGIMKSNKSMLHISVTHLEFKVNQGESYSGSVFVDGAEDPELYFKIFSSNIRMKLQEVKYDGERIEIPFVFTASGLSVGDFRDGKIYILSESGEYMISFQAEVVIKIEETAVGAVKNLFHFANLVQINSKQAYLLFFEEEFNHVFQASEQDYKLLYRGFSNGKKCYQSVEEFLIAVHKKQPIFFEIENEEKVTKEFVDLEENVLESFIVKKDIWGYLNINVIVDAPFIKIKNSTIESKDFIGKKYQMSYEIDVSKLHYGKNWGNISLSNQNQNIVIPICVIKTIKNRKEHDKVMFISDNMRKIIIRYLMFRMKQISTKSWAKDTITLSERLLTADEDNVWYKMFIVQARLVNNQMEDAKWILDSIEKTVTENKDEFETRAFYLYLQTLVSRNKEFVDQVSKEIRMIQKTHQDSWILTWILLFIDESLQRNPEDKLDMIYFQIEKGCHSPILYIEAYYLFLEDVFLLQQLGKSQLLIMMWISKEKAMTLSMANQLFRLVSREKSFSSLLYRLMKIVCERFETVENLSSMCGYLIRNNIHDEESFIWYEKAVNKNIRLTKLYEYYMMSFNLNQELEIPKIVLLYFQFDNDLSSRRKAYLYRYVLENKDRNHVIFKSYQVQMEKFAIKSLLQQRINRNYSRIYSNIFSESSITSEIANSLGEILFSNRLVCNKESLEQSGIKYVVVVHEMLEREQKVPVIDGEAIVQILSENCVILFEDQNGCRFRREQIEFELEEMMPVKEWFETCFLKSQNSIPLIIYYLNKKKNLRIEDELGEEVLFYLEKSDQINEQFKKEIRKEIIIYFHQTQKQTMDSVQFFEEIDFEELLVKERGKVIEYLIMNRRYDMVIAICRKYGFEQVSVPLLLKFCTFYLFEKEQMTYWNKDELLLDICEHCVFENKYTEIVLRYLVLYYESTLKQMLYIWEKAIVFELDTVELGEKIILQYLNTNSSYSKVNQVFEIYYKEGLNRKIKQAYLFQESYKYLINEDYLSDRVFKCLVKEYLYKELKDDFGKLAILKKYASKPLENDRCKTIVEFLLDEYIGKKMFFQFYKQYPRELINKYQLKDITIIEYHTRQKGRVEIQYEITQDEETDQLTQVEEMQEIIEGIYVKTFVLFFGEYLHYTVNEYGEKKITNLNKKVQYTDLTIEKNRTKFDILNDISLYYTLRDFDKIDDQMQEMLEKEYVVTELFKLL